MRKRSRRVIFVNRFYFPDHSATAQILTDVAEALVARGWSVTIVTSRLQYDDPSANLAAVADHEGVVIRRVATTRFGRATLLRRVADYVSFYVSALGALLGLLRAGDIVVAKTDPPLLSVVVAVATRLRGATLVNWLQDLYPEVAAELGVAAMRGPLGAVLRRIRNVTLRLARCNVTIGERMAERLLAAGLSAERVTVLPNWSDDNAIAPLPPKAVSLREKWGLGDRFVLSYSGNLGRAHEADTMLGAARLLRDRDDIVFLMIGGGHASPALARRVADEGLQARVQFRPYQPREQLCESLAVGDLHWLSLRPALEGLIVPSKFYGIAAAGRGVIAITDPDGEIARMVKRDDCGIVVSPGDCAGLANAVIGLAADPARVAEMGQAARRMLERDYRQAQAFDRWDDLLHKLS